jgi:hypothetical protein
MAPLPYNNTPIYEVFYTVNGHQHSYQVRTGVISPAAFGTVVDAFHIALGTLMYPTVIDYVTFQPSGSNVSNIVTTGIEGNTYGAGTPTITNVPQYINFVGRSTGGRRVRLAVFGTTSTGTDYRFLAGEQAQVDNAIAVLNGATQAYFAIDNIKAVWKSYANAGLNAYWQREVRP